MKDSEQNNKPFAVEVEEGKSYFWCSCGFSKKQPFCDSSHKEYKNEDGHLLYKPLLFKSNKKETILFCGCKNSKTKPICDGSHSKLNKNGF